MFFQYFKLLFFKLLRSQRTPVYFTYFFIFLYVLGGIAINLNRFWQFELGYYDFGIFDRAIWSISRFRAPIIDHFIVPGKWIFADHFNPSVMLLAPIYWVTDLSEAIIIMPSIAVGVSAVIIFKIATVVLKNRYLAFSVTFIYLMSIGLQNAVYSDFHELTLATAAISFCYWAVVTKRIRLFFVGLLFTLGFKESFFLFGIGTAIFIFFYNKEWRNIAFITLMISLVWGVAVIKVVIPFFSGNEYYYVTSENVSTNPTEFISTFISPTIKLKTVFFSFANYLFIAIGYLPLIPTILFNFASRFITTGSIRWDLGLHYNAEIAPTFAVATILSLAYIQKRISTKMSMAIGVLLVLNSLFFHRFLFHGPMGLAYHPAFYQNTKNHVFLKKLVEKIPPNVTVAAQNNLASHLMHQPEIWILRENYPIHKADYLILDLREGQNPSNTLGINNSDLLLKQIQHDTEYEVYFNEGDQYIFKRLIKNE